jgi:glyoxylase I family protein
MTGATTHANLKATREARRNRNKIRRLHHHAVRTDDMNATRHFYEDVLGMPMIAALTAEIDSTTGRKTPFLHCFFEMGDGGCLAFFQFLPGDRGPANQLPKDAIDHHIAMAVANFDDLARVKAKLDELGYPNCGINHGFCYSLYVRDPNGMMVEFVADGANELEFYEAAAASAHEALAKWDEGDYSPNNPAGETATYPLPTSPRELIAKVMHGA